MKQIEGTFLQFWWSMREVDGAQREREIAVMHTAGMRTITLECFRLTNNNPSRPSFAPAPPEQIVQQLKAISPYVERVVTFDFYHYMSPYRGEAQKELYDGYLRLVVHKGAKIG